LKSGGQESLGHVHLTARVGDRDTGGDGMGGRGVFGIGKEED